MMPFGLTAGEEPLDLIINGCYDLIQVDWRVQSNRGAVGPGVFLTWW